MNISITAKEIPLKLIKMSIDDVEKIFVRLLGHVHEQGDREVNRLVKSEKQSEDEFNEYKNNIKEGAFRVTVTIIGSDGARLFGDNKELFRSANLPDKISSIYMSNITAYEGVIGSRPANLFQLTLDFSEPPLIDALLPVSSPTPNNSLLIVSGKRDSWVASISDAVFDVLNNRKVARGLPHRSFAYDVGLFVFGFPFSFWACWVLSDFIETYLALMGGFVSGLAYVYVVLVSVFIYRILFGYTRWAFPTMELESKRNNATKHRVFWYGIITSIVSGLIVSIFLRIF